MASWACLMIMKKNQTKLHLKLLVLGKCSQEARDNKRNRDELEERRRKGISLTSFKLTERRRHKKVHEGKDWHMKPLNSVEVASKSQKEMSENQRGAKIKD